MTYDDLLAENAALKQRLAEWAIRPAVIVRQTSAGNRSERGARVQAVVTSLWQTCRQQKRDFVGVVTALLRSPQPQAVLLVPVERLLIRSP